MKKIKVYLDMDGTIADLYNEENWLEKLQKEDKKVFLNAKPMITEKKLKKFFPSDRYELTILSMTPKNASKKYIANVIDQKNQWLDKYFPSITKRIYKNYSNNKNLKNSKNAILIDDNKNIRDNYKGIALYPMWN